MQHTPLLQVALFCWYHLGEKSLWAFPRQLELKFECSLQDWHLSFSSNFEIKLKKYSMITSDSHISRLCPLFYCNLQLANFCPFLERIRRLARKRKEVHWSGRPKSNRGHFSWSAPSLSPRDAYFFFSFSLSDFLTSICISSVCQNFWREREASRERNFARRIFFPLINRRYYVMEWTIFRYCGIFFTTRPGSLA